MKLLDDLRSLLNPSQEHKPKSPLTMSMRDFRNSRFSDMDAAVYVLRSPQEVVYVGLSGNPWGRWFSTDAHLFRNLSPQEFGGATMAGQEFVANFPDSWNWTIELYSLGCLSDKFGAIPPGLHCSEKQKLRLYETHMIRTLHPTMNKHHNGYTP